MSHARAKSIIVELSDRQFDPLIVELFLASEDAFERLADKLGDPVDAEGSTAARVDSPSRSGSAALQAEPPAIAPRDRPAIVSSGRASTCTDSPRL